MVIGRVVSTVVSTSKHPDLCGLKLLVIEPYLQEKKECFVAADAVGAGIGQLVLVSFGDSARDALPKKTPVDATVVGIVDSEPDILRG